MTRSYRLRNATSYQFCAINSKHKDESPSSSLPAISLPPTLSSPRNTPDNKEPNPPSLEVINREHEPPVCQPTRVTILHYRILATIITVYLLFIISLVPFVVCSDLISSDDEFKQGPDAGIFVVVSWLAAIGLVVDLYWCFWDALELAGRAKDNKGQIIVHNDDEQDWWLKVQLFMQCGLTHLVFTFCAWCKIHQ